jgi:CubicO group peptidase (beta-lactamase class C family)
MRPNQITLDNWQDPDNTGWSYRHVRELIPTARIRRDQTPSPLGDADPARSGLPVDRILADDRTDGVIVLHRGELVLEQYRRGMAREDVHLLQSVSKSITGTVAGILIGSGELAPDDLISAHVPELADTSFMGATVRDLLDMRAGTTFDETYVDPASDIRASEAQFGWSPAPAPSPDALAYLGTLRNQREHGGRFEYRSILTDVLGLVIERAAQKPYAEVLGDRLWSRIGTETDAYVTVDRDGFSVADGGICVSLRDLARFGQMVLDDGVLQGRRIVASEWLSDTLRGAEDSKEAFAADPHSEELEGGHYRNQWWVPAGGQELLALGIHGQFLFVDYATGTVVAQLSTWETSLDPVRRAASLTAFRATGRALASGGAA